MESFLVKRDRIGVQDFVLLEDFRSETSFLDNLRKRFKEGLIYVSSIALVRLAKQWANLRIIWVLARYVLNPRLCYQYSPFLCTYRHTLAQSLCQWTLTSSWIFMTKRQWTSIVESTSTSFHRICKTWNALFRMKAVRCISGVCV